MAGHCYKFKFGLLLASISWGYARRQAAEGAQGCLRARLLSAAEALSYTQPAISQQIAALEKSAGATLVDRTSKGVRLTDAGRARRPRPGRAGPPTPPRPSSRRSPACAGDGRLASFSTASASLLPPALCVSERHPDVELTFSDTEPEDALQMLRAGELEVAVVPVPRAQSRRANGSTAGSSCTRWSRTRCTWRCRWASAGPQAARAAPGRGRRGRGSRRATPQRLQPPPEGGLPVRGLRAEGGLPIGRLQRPGLVASGMGVSLLPSLALANMREDIVVRSLGRTAPARKIGAATLAGRYRSPPPRRCSASSRRWRQGSNCPPAPRLPPPDSVERTRRSASDLIAPAGGCCSWSRSSCRGTRATRTSPAPSSTRPGPPGRRCR